MIIKGVGSKDGSIDYIRSADGSVFTQDNGEYSLGPNLADFSEAVLTKSHFQIKNKSRWAPNPDTDLEFEIVDIYVNLLTGEGTSVIAQVELNEDSLLHYLNVSVDQMTNCKVME